MKNPETLLKELSLGAPFQPATNIWRAVELDAVQQHGLPLGRGLDLGCGDGKLTKVVRDAMPAANGSRQWVGVDIDPAETSQAMALGIYERVHTCSASSIPEPDASFDFVFSNSVLEHIEPIDEVLAEASRLLRPGGLFICTVPGPNFHACLAGQRSPRLARAEYEREIDARCAHLRYWSEETWRTHLEAKGLGLRISREYLTQQQLRRWESVSAWTGGVAYRLFGRRARPIEIQRRLKLRGARPSLAGRMGAAAAMWAARGCPLSSQERGQRYGCLLLEAVKSSEVA